MSTPASLAGLVGLTALRLRAAALLEPAEPADPGLLADLAVLADVPDSIAPPVLLLLWRDDPWLEPQPNARGSTFRAQLQILCVAGRIDPAPGIELLEELVAYVCQRMHTDSYGWGLPTVTAPRQEPIGGLNYLAAAITYRVAVTTEEE